MTVKAARAQLGLTADIMSGCPLITEVYALQPYLQGCQLPNIVRKGCQLVVMEIQNLQNKHVCQPPKSQTPEQLTGDKATSHPGSFMVTLPPAHCIQSHNLLYIYLLFARVSEMGSPRSSGCLELTL